MPPELNDIIGISKGNHSWLRAESNDLAIHFDFRKNFDKIEFIPAVIQSEGTRFCLILIDSRFESISRSTVDEVIENFMETL